ILTLTPKSPAVQRSLILALLSIIFPLTLSPSHPLTLSPSHPLTLSPSHPLLGTLKEIAVEGGVENLVNQSRQLLGLGTPCPGSTYSALFKDAAPKSGYSYDMDLEDDSDITSS